MTAKAVHALSDDQVLRRLHDGYYDNHKDTILAYLIGAAHNIPELKHALGNAVRALEGAKRP